MSSETREIQEIHTTLSYDPVTGFITSKRTGKRRGTVTKRGYVRVRMRLEGVPKWRLAHRLAFVLMLGRWPLDQVDHVNLDKSDNRWSNLREATQGQNNVNITLSRKNTSGFRGVYWHAREQRWRSFIHVGGKKRHLGVFRTKEEAAEAHCAAGIKFFGPYFRAEYLIEY